MLVLAGGRLVYFAVVMVQKGQFLLSCPLVHAVLLLQLLLPESALGLQG